MRKKGKAPRLSLAAQGLGYRAFLVFFLGSIVPLAFLAYVADRYVFPALASSHQESQALSISVAILMIAFLAFLAYLVLGKAAREAIAETQGYNDRLKMLLDLAGSLNATPFSDLLRKNTLESAARLVSPRAAYFFQRSPDGAEAAAWQPEMWGPDAAELHRANRDALGALAAHALSGRRPALVGDAFPGGGPRGPGGTEAGLRVASAMAVPIAVSDETFGALVLVRAGAEAEFGQADLDAVSALAQQAATALHNASLRESQKNFFAHVTQLLVEALDLHVQLQVGHSKRVAHCSDLVGRELKLEEGRLSRLYFAALLHDLGMLRIDPQEGKAQEADYRDHPALGFKMVSPITVWSDIAPVILHHHEWYDGRGYPKGLKGEEIPLEARIIGLAEAFDSMTHRNSYRQSVPMESAVREITACSGTQFDPAVVAAFLELVKRDEIEV